MKQENIKALIDKILIEELSSEENIYLLNKLEEYPELNEYYHETLKMKSELSLLSEEQPFEQSDLLSARETLFDSIEESDKKYSFLKYAASMFIGMLIPTMYFILATQAPIEDSSIIALDVQDIGNNQIQLTGQKVSSFKFEGSTKDKNIQRMLIDFVQTNPNAGHKFTAMDYLSEVKDGNQELIDTYLMLAEDERNLGLRLKSISVLSNYTHRKDVQTKLISILKNEADDLIKSAIFDVLSKGELQEEEKSLFQQANFKRKY